MNAYSWQNQPDNFDEISQGKMLTKTLPKILLQIYYQDISTSIAIVKRRTFKFQRVKWRPHWTIGSRDVRPAVCRGMLPAASSQPAGYRQSNRDLNQQWLQKQCVCHSQDKFVISRSQLWLGIPWDSLEKLEMA